MLLVVMCRPSKFTLTGGVELSGDAMARLRIGAEAVPVALTRLGNASVWSTCVSELTAPVGKVKLEAFRMPTTLASRAFRLALSALRLWGVAPTVLSRVVSTL